MVTSTAALSALSTAVKQSLESFPGEIELPEAGGGVTVAGATVHCWLTPPVQVHI